MFPHAFSKLYDEQWEEHVTCDLCGHTFSRFTPGGTRRPRHETEPLVHLVVVHGAPQCESTMTSDPIVGDDGIRCELPAGHVRWHNATGRTGLGRTWQGP